MDPNKQLYLEEAYELLADLENSLIELEQRPDDRGLIDRIFRAMHTIKGSGAMFGFDAVASFTHTIETVYDCIREDSLKVDGDLVSLTLSACDQIKDLLAASQDQATVDESELARITAAFQKLISKNNGPDSPKKTGVSDPGRNDTDHDREVTYRIRFIPHLNLFENGTNPILLLNELRGFGQSRIIAHLDKLPDLREMDPEACYVSWDIILTTAAPLNDIRDVFIFVEDLSDITIDVIDLGDCEDEDYLRIGEILFDRGDISLTELEGMLGKQKRIGEIFIDSGVVQQSEVTSALVEQEHVRSIRKNRGMGEGTSSIRVASDKLDSLVNLVGELVTVQARLTQFSATQNSPDLTAIAEEVERLSAELRDNTMGIRMLPIGTTFAKFKRLVRDLSTQLGKEVAFTTEGAETELDKTVIEKLSDPLVHLIRNSLDHGIEPPEVRRAADKPSEGTIHLSAVHSGAQVLVSIRDDGAGLDSDAIRAKALERGLISRDACLSEKELFDLILTPGFSTAKNVTSVSGRGVGMDVVTSSIESFGGSVEISSQKGSGTTITLKLPLTLAIIDGLLVTIGGDYFVIPLGSVVECVELSARDKRNAHGRHIVKVREEIVPYIPLREVFAITAAHPPIEQIVITESGDHRVGFVVDKVIGSHQTVIKNMGKVLKNIEGVSGATIMGDGTVALILDINRLTLRAEVDEITSFGRRSAVNQ